MAKTLDEMLATLPPSRREAVLAEGERLNAEYSTLQDLRKARDLTQVALADTMGVRQATVAKYERQTDLLLSTLKSYVAALGGSLDLIIRFPDKPPLRLEQIGEPSEVPVRRRRKAKGKTPSHPNPSTVTAR